MPGGTDLAQGYVQLMPSMEGFIGKVRAELGAPLDSVSKIVGKSMGSNMLQSIGSSMSQSGRYLTSHITAPAMAAAAVVGGIFSAKGFQRLTAIDDARAKLVALRFDAGTVETVMSSALESVKNTAYGLGEAATTAAGAVAAGVKPGQDLTRYLSLTADAAAVAGVNMDEMGSILNKAQTQNKAYNMELQMLADKGLPVYQWLADAAGVSAEEIFKMAEKGEISSQMLYSAIETNIGGAAKTMGGLSLSATMQNIWAAAGRVGAAFLGAGDDANSFFAQLKPLFANLTTWLDIITPYATELGRVFGESFGIIVQKFGELGATLGLTMPTLDEFKVMIAGIPAAVTGAMDWLIAKVVEIKNWFSGLPAPIQNFIATLGGIAPIALVALGPVLSIGGKVMSVLSGLVSGVSSVVGAMSTGIGVVSNFVGGLRGVESAASSAAGKLGIKTAALWANFTAMAANAASGIAGVFTKIGTSARNAATKVLALAAAKKGLAIASLGIIGVVGGLAAYMIGTGTSFGELGQKISGFASQALEMIKGVVSQIPGIVSAIGPVIASFVTEILPQFLAALPGLITAGAEILVGLINSFTAMLPAFIETGVQILVSLIEGFTAALPQVIAGVVSAITGIVNALVTALPLFIEAALALVMGLVTALPQILPPLIEGLVALIQGLVGVLPTLIPLLIQAALQLFMALVTALPMIISALINAALMVINALVGMLPTLIPVLLDAALQLFMAIVGSLPVILPALIEGIISIIMAVVGMLPTLIPILIEAAIQLFMALVQAIPLILSALLGAVGSLITSGINHLSTFLSSLGENAKALFMGIVDAVPKILSDLVSNIGSLIQSGIDAIGDWISGMITAGENLIRGVVEGIGNGISWITGKIEEVCGGALDAIKNFFGIASPSKVMAQMGGYLMQGLATGIDDKARLVTSALTDVAKDATGIMGELAADMEIPVRSAINTSAYSSQTPSYQSAAGQTNNYTIGNVTYTPDSRIAELMDALFTEVSRTQRMGV